MPASTCPARHIKEAEEADAVPLAVRHGQADLGLAELGHVSVAALVPTVDFRQALVVVAPPGVRLADPSDIRELADQPIIATPRGTSTRRLVDQTFQQIGTAAHIAVEVDQREAILPLVLAGAGISFVPDRMADKARDAGATVVRPEPTITRRVALLARSHTPGPAATALIRIASRDTG